MAAPQALAAVQAALNALHAAVALEPDPSITADLSKCLRDLTLVQKNLMVSAQQGGQGGPAPAQQSGYSPPQNAQGVDPRQQIMAALQGGMR